MLIRFVIIVKKKKPKVENIFFIVKNQKFIFVNSMFKFLNIYWSKFLFISICLGLLVVLYYLDSLIE
jgi:hypothetical protein